MYAIVRVGNKQYRVEQGDSIVVDRLAAGEGETLQLEPLLLSAEHATLFEPSELGCVRVHAVVRGHERGKKLHVLKFKPKKGYKRRTGHRADLTRLEIADVSLAPAGARRGRAGGDGGS
jgi:large subunit ribosomal protein L21